MNTNRAPENNAPLREVLREWVVDAPLPPRFQEQVWQRIARAETAPQSPRLTELWRFIEVFLPRPKFALSYLAIVLMLGLAAGFWAAQIKTSRLDSALSLRYVQSIDPYRTAASHP